MERLERIAPQGKVLKLQSEDSVCYAYKINAIPAQAELWVEVDESEYIDWLKAQEEEIQTV